MARKKEISNIPALIKRLMQNNVSQTVMSDTLGYPVASFRNKLSQDRFSISDLIAICDICGYNLMIAPKGKESDIIYLKSEEYITDKELLDRINTYKAAKLQDTENILNKYLAIDDENEKQTIIQNVLDSISKK